MGSPRKRPPRTPKPKSLPTPKESERPPRLPVGDSDPDIIFRAVGRALTAWERLEGTLGLIFVGSIGQTYVTGMAALRAYGTVISFNGRYDMLTKALEAAIFQRRDEVSEDLFGQDEHLVKFIEDGKFLSRVKEFSSRRNEIAHGVVDRHPNITKLADLFSSKPKFGWVLLPSEYATRQKELARGGILRGAVQKPLYYYTAGQIDGFTAHFEKLLVSAQTYLKSVNRVVAGLVPESEADD